MVDVPVTLDLPRTHKILQKKTVIRPCDVLDWNFHGAKFIKSSVFDVLTLSLYSMFSLVRGGTGWDGVGMGGCRKTENGYWDWDGGRGYGDMVREHRGRGMFVVVGGNVLGIGHGNLLSPAVYIFVPYIPCTVYWR